MGSFVFRWSKPADHVYVTGTFDDWGKTERLEKVGDVFEKEVALSDVDEKIYYKFVVDDQWIVDEDAPKENDGHYNVNNVLKPQNIKKTAPADTEADSIEQRLAHAQQQSQGLIHRITGSSSAQSAEDISRNSPAVTETAPIAKSLSDYRTQSRSLMQSIASSTSSSAATEAASTEKSLANTQNEPRGAMHRVLSTSSAPPGSNKKEGALSEAPTVSAGGEGAPLLSEEKSSANLARWIPYVTPDPSRPVTRSLPQTDGASASRPEKKTALTEAPTVSAGGAGAPLLSEADSRANLARQTPDVTPDSDRPVTRSLSQDDEISTSQPASQPEVSDSDDDDDDDDDDDMPGAFPRTPFNDGQTFNVTPIPATGHQNAQSSITTSKEDYENAGGEGSAGGNVSALPIPATGAKDLNSTATTSKEDYDKVGADDEQVSVAPLPATGHDNAQSSVTTSKEDYENAGGEGTAGGTVSAFPIPATGARDLTSSATTSKEDYDKAGADDEQVSVQPLPATGHDNVQSSVTTSQEDYENAGGEGTAGGAFSALPNPTTDAKDLSSPATTSKDDYDKVNTGGEDDQQVSVNPQPATGHENIQSSVTTTKEDYERAGAIGAAGAGVAGVGAAIAGATGAFSKPKDNDKNIIPESSLPMNTKETDTMDRGPFISSAGPGTTTAALASQVPLEPKREAQVVESETEAPSTSKEAASTPFINSSGPGTTTSDLASQVPLESQKDTTSTAFMRSSGPGTTTSELASQVPLESNKDTSVVSDEVVAEKSAVEQELLRKVPTSNATGEPASAAAAQSSYYGLATNVPAPVEESIAKAHASPEAATDPSVVAEKSAFERELQQVVPREDSAGEPAPTLSASTATTAPGDSNAALAVVDLTDGKTANEPVPDTDTSTASRGVSAGEVAGGAAVGAAAAAGATTLAARHKDNDIEPPRIADSLKPDVTSEVTPVQQTASPSTTTAFSAQSDTNRPPTAGIGAASPAPGVSPAAGAALSDGTENAADADEPSAPRTKAPVETSEATATEYAPPRAPGLQPGVSPAAAAALSDGTEDPTLSEEPAVQMMAQNEAMDAGAASTATSTKAPTAGAGVTSFYHLTTSDAPSTAAGVADVSPIAEDKTIPTTGTIAPTTTSGVSPIGDDRAVSTTGTTAVPATTVDKSIVAADETTVPATTEATSADNKIGSAPVYDAITDSGTDNQQSERATSAAAVPTTPEKKTGSAIPRDPSPMTRPDESVAAGKSTAETPKKAVAGPAASGTTPASNDASSTAQPAFETPKKTTAADTTASASSTPAKSTTSTGTPGDEKKKKKRHRLSQIIKDIFK